MIDIVIVNWNAGAHIGKCIDSLFKLGDALVFQVIVVDNASTDDSLHSVLPRDGLVVVRNEVNVGFAAACNQGARLGTAANVLFLNPDTIVQDAAALQVPVQFMAESENASVGIAGVQLVGPHGEVARTSTRFPTPARVLSWTFGLDRLLPRVFKPQFLVEDNHRKSRAVDVVMGAFFFARRDVFNLLGGFDEKFFVYYEEVDFCRRAATAGYSTRFLAESSVFHAGHGTTEQIKAKRYFLITRSRIIYGFKHFGRMWGTILMAASISAEPIIRVAFSLARGNFRAAVETISGARMLWGFVSQEASKSVRLSNQSTSPV